MKRKRKPCFANGHCCYDCPNAAIEAFEDRYDIPASDAGYERIKCKDCYLNTGDCTDCLFQNSADCPEEGGPAVMTDPKDYLMQYREAVQRLHNTAEHLTELREIAESLKNEQGQRIALDRAVADLVDAQEQAAAELEHLNRLRTEILDAVRRVPDTTQENILYRRYILGEKWEQIAVALHLDYRWVLRLHGRALQKLTIESHP